LESRTVIEFKGIDVVAERKIDSAEIRHALMESLSVVEERIIVIYDMGDYPQSGAADVVCVISPVDGEFSSLLSIQTDGLTLPYNGVLELVQRLAEILRTRCLVPDEGLDPYVMWLASPGQPVQRVGLDVAALNEDRYVVSPESSIQ
jgi:hypothetical protein